MRNTFSIILVIILVVATPAMLLVTSVKYNLATAKFLKQELVKQGAYQIALDQVDQQIGKISIDPQVPITPADLQALARRVLTIAWLQPSVESSLDRTFAWFKSPDSTTLSLPIDLAG